MTMMRALTTAFLLMAGKAATAGTLECLTQAVYMEARGESETGMTAVAHVVMNRSRMRRLSPCRVINQRGQFTFKHGAKRTKDQEAREVARATLRGNPDPTNGATYFHKVGLNPRWAEGMKRKIRIGRHVFYVEQ